MLTNWLISQTTPRLEKKHHLRQDYLPPSQEPHLTSHHPPRRIHSIYFDDPCFTNAHANLRGDYTRLKIRLRWHATNTPNKAQHEYKAKVAQSAYKLVLPQIKPLKLPNWLESFALTQVVSTQCQTLTPTSYVSYQSQYFQNHYRTLRVTFDSHLTSHTL